MSERQVYQQRLEAQIEKWQAEIDLLKAKAKAATADAKIDYTKQIQELDAMLSDAREKLEQLKETTEDSWQDLSKGFEKAWLEMQSAMNVAISRFQGML